MLYKHTPYPATKSAVTMSVVHALSSHTPRVVYIASQGRRKPRLLGVNYGFLDFNEPGVSYFGINGDSYCVDKREKKVRKKRIPKGFFDESYRIKPSSNLVFEGTLDDVLDEFRDRNYSVR